MNESCGNGRKSNNAQKAQHQQEDQNRNNAAPTIPDATVVITAAAEEKHQDNNKHNEIHNRDYSIPRCDYQWGLHPMNDFEAVTPVESLPGSFFNGDAASN